MTRLIDADAIPWLVEGVGEIPVITKEEIDQMPTVDAVPVRHGKWMRTEDECGDFLCWTCSECGEQYVMPHHRASYCPNCGARMNKLDQKYRERQ